MSTFYTPDGAAVNTAPKSTYTQGSVQVTASCSVASEANYILSGVAPTPCVGTITPTAVRTTNADASPLGTFNAVVRAGQVFAGSAAHNTIGSVNAFVIRIVETAVSLAATASILAIPADVLGESDASSVASISAGATLIRPALSDGTCTADVALTSDVVVTRNVVADILGTGEFYGTTGVNGVYEGFLDIPATATLTVADVGIVFRQSTAQTLAGIAAVAPIATLILPGEMDSVARATTVIPEGTISITSGSVIAADCTFVADSTLTSLISADFSTASQVLASANQVFQGQVEADPAAEAALQAAASIIFEGSAITIPIPNATVVATGVIVKVSNAVVSTAASIANDDTVTQQLEALLSLPSATVVPEARIAERGEADISAPSSVTASPKIAERGESDFSTLASVDVFNSLVTVTRFVDADIPLPFASATSEGVIIKVGIANTAGECTSVDADALIFEQGFSDIAATSQVIAEGTLIKKPLADVSANNTNTLAATRIVFPTCLVDCAVHFFADSIANPDSFDPEERTFTKPPSQFQFVRPFQQFVFKRTS